MMLTGPEILARVRGTQALRAAGIARPTDEQIVIEPFRPEQLNPNSYNLCLADELVVYDVAGSPEMTKFADGHLPACLDMAVDNPHRRLRIPPAGLVLRPGVLYLGATAEYTEPFGLVPCIEGRSSIARLGLCVHVTAGFGDCAFCGTWTLELTVVHPLRVYAGVQVCQIAYSQVQGQQQPYQGKYQKQTGPRPSGLWKE